MRRPYEGSVIPGRALLRASPETTTDRFGGMTERHPAGWSVVIGMLPEKCLRIAQIGEIKALSE
jgi:hypothetical protein